MGITEYVLRRPHVLQGESNISPPTDTGLLVVTKAVRILEDTLVSDVLRTLKISPQQVFCVTPEQLVRLSSPLLYPCWCMEPDTKIDTHKPILHTMTLDRLHRDPQAKRMIWKQIYENDFLTQIR